MKGKAARRARAAGQSLSPTVFVGHAGVTDAVAAEVVAQLKSRDLVKVRLAKEVASAGERRALGEALAAKAGAELVEVRGFTLLLTRAPKARGR